MRGDPAIQDLLNEVLTNELTAVNQYFLHARMFEDWGFAHLGRIVYEESIGEMKHADRLVKRLLFLKKLPNLQDLHKLSIGENVRECLEADLQLELNGRAKMIEGIALCERSADYVSRDILTDILKDTEQHIDFLDTQLGLIQALGEQNYLQSAMHDIQTDNSATGG